MASYTQAQLDALRAAIATGALRVDYGDRSVTYRSLDEMQTLERIMSADVAGPGEARWAVAGFSKD